MPHYSSLKELYITRLREFYRQPARIFWVYGFPTIMAVALGLAFNNRPPEAVHADLVQNAHSDPIEAALREYDTRTPQHGRIRLVLHVGPAEEAAERLRNGDAPLMVVPRAPKDAGGAPAVEYHFDPTRPEATMARLVFDDTLERALGRADMAPVIEKRIAEPGSRYIDFLIPGLIGVNTMGGGLWGVGFLLVNFRIAKLLKRFMATPMPRRNFLLALLGARLTFLLPDVTALLALGVFAFHMPIRGSLFLVVLVAAVGSLAFCGIGLLVGSRAQSTEAVSGLMNLVMLPMWLFSGVFFKAESFPAAMQPFIQALPLTQLVNALRMVILRGADLMGVAGPLAILAAWAVVTFLLALRLFRWT